MIEHKIDFWKKSLLDLGKRNRLINYKKTKRSNIKISSPELEEIFITLVCKEKSLSFSHIVNEKYVDGELLYDSFSNGDIQTDQDIVDQQITLRNLRSKARVSMQERGTNILYLSFGFLNWKEVSKDKEWLRSPLVLVPVSISIKSVTDPFVLTLHEDEIVINPTLAHRFESDYNVVLPNFDDFDEDVLGCLEAIEEIVQKNGWSVDKSVDLSLLTFLKINMYKDIENNIDRIKGHHLLKALCGDTDGIDDISPEYDHYDHDNKTNPADMFQVVDADSSQQDAILYSKNGVSFVLQGPPGTGKSQTITNIIAEGLADGKKILFVSEKMAALEIVYNRLSQVDLADFCLTLHNPKVKKKDVLNDLEATLHKQKTQFKEDAFYYLQKLQKNRTILNTYVKDLHTKNMPLNKSVYDVNGILANLDSTKDVVFSLPNVALVDDDKLFEYRALLEDLANTVKKMQVDIQDNPWLNCKIKNLTHELRHDLEGNLDHIILGISKLTDLTTTVSSEFGWVIGNSVDELEKIIKVFEFFTSIPQQLPKAWFESEDINLLYSILEKQMEIQEEYLKKREVLSERYQEGFFSLPPEEIVKKFGVLKRTIAKTIRKTSYLSMNSVKQSIGTILQDLGLAKTGLAFTIENIASLQQKYSFTSVNNFDQIYALGKILGNIIKNPKPTEMWFDESKETYLNRLLTDAETKFNTIKQLKTSVTNEFDKEILTLDYRPILTRFRTEYTGFAKVFKKTYASDKKIILGFYGQASKKLDDQKIVKTLEVLKQINDGKMWIAERKELLSNAFGKHYVDEYTDWNGLEESLKNFMELKKQLGTRLNTTEIKQLLLSGVIEDRLVCSTNMAILSLLDKQVEKKIHHIISFNGNLKQEPLENIQSTLEEFENTMTTFGTLLHEVCSFTKSKSLSYEKIINDLKMLNKLKNFEREINSEEETLFAKFSFLYNGLETNWSKTLESLDWAKTFSELISRYKLPNEFVSKICSAEYSLKISNTKEKLEDCLKEFEPEWNWFNGYFKQEEKMALKRIPELTIKLEKCLHGLAYLEEWTDYERCKDECQKYDLAEFVNKAEKEGILKTQLVDAFMKRFYRMWLDKIVHKYPSINTFRGANHKLVIDEFRELDERQFSIAKARLKEQLLAHLPDLNKSTSAFDEVGVLKRELNKRRKIMPLRKLFKAIPNLLMALKPCLMMSPLSVSMFLESGTYNFDMVIFDEASQVRTEDAVGAIMRGKQIIVCGDKNQLPPTSFFMVSTSDQEYDIDEEDLELETDEYESILEESLTILPERTLRWHYRSKNEQLIAFSNAKIYNHDLITFPTNYDYRADNGVEYIYVEDGIYDRGGSRTNQVEAQKVAELVFEHFDKYPDRSLGVVTFSGAQQQAVENSIRELRLQNKSFEKHFNEDTVSPFFVKNLETVQGDERDTIIFSIGYAKDDRDKPMRMNFGPLNRVGGERRLNVAITRAKYNIKLVTSIVPHDIDLERTSSEGVRLLKAYIDFSINGTKMLGNDKAYSELIDNGSSFEKTVCTYLQKRGYDVVTQLGCSEYRIDLAVKHPKIEGRYILGIECDGTAYSQARTARERDRTREAVLHDIGWNTNRIWSTDWIKDPVTEGDNIVRRIDECIESYTESLPMKSSFMRNIHDGNSFEANFDMNDQDEIDSSYETVCEENSVVENPYNFKKYAETLIEDVIWNEEIDTENNYLVRIIKYVVEKESPIHFDLLCKRIAPVFNRQKVTSVVKNSIKSVDFLYQGDITIKDDYYWWNDTKKIEVRIPYDSGNVRTIDYIATEELAEAMIVITNESYGITDENLMLATAKVFGFGRAGAKITKAMEKAFQLLLETNKIALIEGKVSVI
ncbi:MAG: DUF3320 domain-containing protein [Caldisericia bacterium]|nr:DUF3320 domain-containing protein [Caldisericia bacterium]